MATEELKKVGLRLTAEGAEDFKAELKDCTATVSASYAEFKKVQSQYDKNTSVTTKLADRQKYLTDVTEAYSDKCKILRTQLTKMEADENADRTAIEKKRAELANTEAKLNDYKKSLEDVTHQLETHSAQLKEWGDKLSAIGDTMQDIGKGMSTYVTAPIVAGATASVAAFGEVDKGLDIVTKKTGATGEELEGYKEIAKDLAQSIPVDFEKAGSAVGEVNTRFNVTGDTLKCLSEQFLQFSELNNSDVSGSIDTVQASMAAWNLTTDKTGAVLDTLNSVGQRTGADVLKLASDAQTNSAAFKEMNFSYSDSINFLGELDKEGIDASTVLTGMKKALTNAAKEGKTMSEALADLSSDLTNAETDTEAYKAAMELFGNKAGPALANALQEGRLSLDALGTSLEDNLGNVADTFEATLDPTDKFTTTLNQVKVTGAEVGGTLLEMLAPALDWVSDKIHQASDWWHNLDEDQQKQIISIAGIVAAIGPALVIGGKVVSGIGTLISVFGTLKSVMGAAQIGIAALNPPILIIIGVVAALIAIGVLLYNNWDTIKEKAAALKDYLSEKWQGIMDKIGAARDFIHNAIEKIKGFFKFEWSLPKLKLPHVKISGSFSLVPPSVPKFSIDWYAKGGILTQPTIFGFNSRSGTALGGGEAGPEAVAPISTLQTYITEAVASKDERLIEVIIAEFDKLFEILEEYYPQFVSDGHSIDRDKLAALLARPIDRELEKLRLREV